VCFPGTSIDFAPFFGSAASLGGLLATKAVVALVVVVDSWSTSPVVVSCTTNSGIRR
jgi:hypothetical protein